MTPIYQRNGIALFEGDMRAVLPQLRGDLIITDPPYNAGKNYGETTNDRMEWPEWCAWFDECLDAMTASAPDVFCFLSQTAYRKYLRHGQREPDWALAWVKPLSLATCALPFMPHWEPIAYWGTTRRQRDGAFWGSDVLTCNVEFGKSRHGHPTPKPLQLMLDFLRRFDVPSKTIIDPFAGSGTTLVAAKILEVPGTGIEINPAYCEGIINRLETEAPLLDYLEQQTARQGLLL